MWIWIKNYKKSSKKLNFKNILNYFDSKLRRLFSDDWEVRQKKWRTTQIKKYSPECYNQGYCKECFCAIDSSKDSIEWQKEPCDLKCFPRWMNKKQWLKFEKNIKHYKNDNF